MSELREAYERGYHQGFQEGFDAALPAQREPARADDAARHTTALDADFIAAVNALVEEVYVPHYQPSSESGPEEWDVELLAPEQATVERVIRHLAAYRDATREPAPADEAEELDFETFAATQGADEAER